MEKRASQTQKQAALLHTSSGPGDEPVLVKTRPGADRQRSQQKEHEIRGLWECAVVLQRPGAELHDG